MAEGNILEGNPNDASPVNVKYETLEVSDKTYKLAELKAVAKEVGVGVSGTKAEVYRKIRLSNNPAITLLEDDPTKVLYKRVKEAEDASAAKWMILDPVNVDGEKFPGINLATGAECGYYGPTNKDNIDGAVKHNYLLGGDKITRPAFAPKKCTPSAPPPNSTAQAVDNTETRSTRSNSTLPPSAPPSNMTPSRPPEVGGMSEEARKLLPDDLRRAQPKDFFNT